MRCIRKKKNFPFPAGETELSPAFITAAQHSNVVFNQSFILLKSGFKVKAFLLYPVLFQFWSLANVYIKIFCVVEHSNRVSWPSVLFFWAVCKGV